MVPELISRLEAATEGNAELDCEIACLVKFPHLRPARPDDFDGRYGDYAGYLKVEHGFLLPDRYTRSLDAALTLVPAGWVRAVDATVPGGGIIVELVNDETNRITSADHVSEPIATCIAALRARAA